MQSKSQRYSFYAIAILSILVVGVAWRQLTRLLEFADVTRDSGLSIPVALFLVAWLYPLKRFDERGVLIGMHSEALKASGFFIFTAVGMPLDKRWGIELPEWGYMLLFVGVLVVSIVLYKIMLHLLSKRTSRKKLVEQVAASDR